MDAVTNYVHRLATSEPAVEKALSEEERALTEAGFVILLGTSPPPLTLSDAQGHTIKLTDFAGRPADRHQPGCDIATQQLAPALESRL